MIAGSSSTAITWTVQEIGGGTITASGVYTAPNQPGTYHVIAASSLDLTQQSSATVTVLAGSASGTIQ